jgi:peptidoglycan/LPS O-acetylase OafA/YrhL
MRYSNLQAGRIAAATLVLVCHASFYGRYVLNVDDPLDGAASAYWFRTTVVFLFALSGFVLAHSLQRGSLRSFVCFRLLRLFPAYWAAIALVVLIRSLTDIEQPFETKRLLKLLVLWPDGRKQLNVLHVEWTLVYELFLSMAIVPLAALGRRRGLGLGCGLWLAACLVKWMLAPSAEPAWLPRGADLPLSLVNVPFLLGVLLYFGQSRFAGGATRTAAIAVAALALTGGAALAGASSGASYLLQSIGAALGVSLLATGRQIASEHPLARAGDWAYGVYLLHVPVLLTFFTLAGRSGWVPATGSLVLFAGVLAFTVGAAYGAAEWAAYRGLRAKLTAARQEENPWVVPFRRPLKAAA